MAKDIKLRSILHRQQNRNFRLEKQRKHEKDASKRKEKNQHDEDSEEEEGDKVEAEDVQDNEVNGGIKLNGESKNDDEDEDDDNEEWEDAEEEIDASRLDLSESDSSEDDEDVAGDEDVENAENDDDIPLSDLDSLASEEKGDIIPHQRLTINNKTALLSALNRIQLPYSTLSFSTHQTITSEEPITIEDIDDDLRRELAFYKQSLMAAVAGRAKLTKEGIPFTRPTDYFAEMVKSDEHMGKIKQKLIDEAAGKKAASEARRQRDLKKFGKQVQVAKLQERDKAKRETLEKISALKRKRANAPLTNEKEEDLFDVALEQEVDRPSKKARGGADGQSNVKRQKKNEKYGFGGKKRHGKSGDAMSTSDMRDYPGAKRMKQSFSGAKKRPGKARRAKGKL